jgi:hypothetical protein
MYKYTKSSELDFAASWNPDKLELNKLEIQISWNSGKLEIQISWRSEKLENCGISAGKNIVVYASVVGRFATKKLLSLYLFRKIFFCSQNHHNELGKTTNRNFVVRGPQAAIPAARKGLTSWKK